LPSDKFIATDVKIASVEDLLDLQVVSCDEASASTGYVIEERTSLRTSNTSSWMLAAAEV